MTINLKREQESTLQRPCLTYSLASQVFFFGMDVLAGRKNSLQKAKLLEILASVPYREWEIKQYYTLSLSYFAKKKVDWAQEIMHWGRQAQDNEYMHLLLIEEKMKEDKLKNKWFLYTPIVLLILFSYVFFSKLVACINIKTAFAFNGAFEDHAEHIYAHMVQENPQWETQKANNPTVKEYGDFSNWADVFRRISLDERDHRNHSFYYLNQPEKIVSYEGMPPLK